MHILVTGANGYIGAALSSALAVSGDQVTGAVRRHSDRLPASVRQVRIGDLAQPRDWSGVLAGVDCVVHAAALAHLGRGRQARAAEQFRRVNVAATLDLARQAAAAGVRRFVFISSIGVNGNRTARPLTESDPPNPVEPYALSKHEAELGLMRLGDAGLIEVVVIRPPLVYGSGAPGNFGRLVRMARSGLPLPLGAVRNRRSLVSLGNLVDFISLCTRHPAARNQTFLVADGQDVSTTELLTKIGRALGQPARLLPVPDSVLRAALGLFLMRGLANKLLGSLQVDISKARSVLGWQPPIDMDAALREMADSLAAKDGETRW